MFDVTLPQSFLPLLPGVVAVTLRVKTAQGSPDSLTDYPTRARKRNATGDELIRSNLLTADSVRAWDFPNYGDGSFVEPKNEGQIVEADGTRWTIKNVGEIIMGAVYPCVCVQTWG